MEKKIYGIIYLLIDCTNDFEYVGQTTRTFEARFNQHKRGKQYIDRIIQERDESLIETAILKVCYSRKELDFWECHFIRSRDTKAPNGYNMTDGGEGTSGIKRSPEYRAKLSAAMTGEKNHRYGKKNTPEHRAKISAGNLGKKIPEETCKNISAALTGKPFTKERCAHISAAKRADSPYKNLIAELDAHQLSYKALEKLMEAPKSTIARKIRGVYNFTDADKIKLEKILGKSIEYLLARSDG